MVADKQGEIPVYWCESCGAEVYTPEETLCKRCKRRRGEDIYGESLPQSLPELQAGERPGEL